MIMLSQQKVLILGARGMLGSDLAKEFAGSVKLTLWDKEELDVTAEAAVLSKIRELSPQFIINATGYTDVAGAEVNPTIAQLLNSEAVKFIVAAASQVGARLVHFSTEYVFDGRADSGYDEMALVSPLNNYGKTKAAGEKFVLNYSKGYLVRTSWLYGQTPQRGKPRGKNFIDMILQLAQEQPAVKVVNDQFGKLTYTVDLAKAVAKLLLNDYAPGVYHLVNESVTTWYEVAREVFRLKGITTPLVPITSDEYADKVVRPQRAILLNTKFPQLRTWQEAVPDYLK